MRQPACAITHDTSGGVNADPIAMPTMSAENDSARRDEGSQLATAREASG